jgi:hypothetical protein
MSQPDDLTCGPTSLHAVYDYYKDNISLEQVVKEVTYLEDGGTLAVMLAAHALSRGYKTRIHTYNLKMFDPTWLLNKETNIIEKLHQQAKYKRGVKFLHATHAYINFLELGGELVFEDLTPALIHRYFKKNIPILAGLSATYLYESIRESGSINGQAICDDVRGYPQGHFVVLCGYDEDNSHIIVADPYHQNPISTDNYYLVKVQRLINSIMLGIITYDANFLIIEPGK